MTDLWSEQLLEQMRSALKAEGCHVEVKIVKAAECQAGPTQLGDRHHRLEYANA